MFRRFIGIISKRYYFEDYVRVYPDEITFNRSGERITPDKNTINNFLNHCKFYKFAAQFVKGKTVADIGCGSGYGCEILSRSGASYVSGADISKRAIRFAQSTYGKFADFSIQGVTNLKLYNDDLFDISISNEVLEHLKEYGKEQIAVREMKRITKRGGLLIIGTPNNEMLEDHGFSYYDITNLLGLFFHDYLIFENALVPFKERKALWESRLEGNQTGEIISQNIDLSETVLPEGVVPEIKRGLSAGRYIFHDYKIDTTLLHNTHSWIILAIND